MLFFFRCSLPMPLIRKAFKRLHYPVDIIAHCARWYLVYSLSRRNLEEIRLSRGLTLIIPRLTAGSSGQYHAQIRRFAGINVILPDGGERTKPTSKSGGSGNTCTGQLTVRGRPSTSCWSLSVMRQLLCISSARLSAKRGTGEGNH